MLLTYPKMVTHTILFQIAVVILVVVALWWYTNRTKFTTVVIDGTGYNVIQRDNTATNLETAQALHEIDTRIETLTKYINQMFPGNTISKHLSTRVLSEAEVSNGTTSYTVNKRDISMCLRPRSPGDAKKVYDINLLMYVVLHELAHVCNYNDAGVAVIGHGREFVRIFKFLITSAIRCGVYQYQDYRAAPQEYCDLRLNTTIVT